MSTNTETISVPMPKIEGSRAYGISEKFVVGSQQIRRNSLQVLRWYMQHRSVASVFWAGSVHPVDLLMGYANDAETFIRWHNHQIWVGFWDILSLLQFLANEEEVRPTLLTNVLSELLLFIGVSQGRELSRIFDGWRPTLPLISSE